MHILGVLANHLHVVIMPGHALSLIEALPVELKQLLMCHLPDVDTLQSICLSCQSFYQAFTSSEALIVSAVLSNHLGGTDLFQEAFLAVVTPHLTQSNCAVSFTNYLRHGFEAISYSIAWALPMGRLHDFIADYAMSFAVGSLRIESGVGNETPVAPTTTELRRCMRAFYRFEILSGLFSHTTDETPHLRRRIMQQFQGHFSPCEQEQVLSVRQYLPHMVAPGSTLRKTYMSPSSREW